MSRLPPLHALRVFEAVARLGGFTQAANELHLTQSAVSHQIRNLEEFFGFALLERTTRSLTLTAAGAVLYESAQHALQVIAQATRRLQANRNQIRISSFPSIAALWLAPRLGEFYRACTGIEVSLATVWERTPSFQWDQYDLVIHYDNAGFRSEGAALLHSEGLTPVCAPSLWERGQGEMPRERLAELTLIHPTAGREDWPCWFAAKGWSEPKVCHEQGVDTDYLAIESALSGAGITVVDPLFVQGYLASGRLVAPFGAPVPTGMHYYLVCPTWREPDERLQKFQRWLMETMAAAEGQTGVLLT